MESSNFRADWGQIDHDPIRLNGINWLDAKRGSIFSERHNNRTLVGNAKDQCAAVDMPPFLAEGALGRDPRFAKAPFRRPNSLPANL